MPSFVYESLLVVGPAAGRRAGVDPPDQPDAASPRPVGGHGVPAGQPEAASQLDPVQATAAAAAADAGRGRGGADGGPAAGAQQLGGLFGGTRDPSRRAAGRQLLDVGPLGRHQRLRRKPRRSSARLAGQAEHQDTPQTVHAAALLAGAPRCRAARSPTCCDEPLDADFRQRLEKVLGPLASFARRPPGRRMPWQAHRPPAAQERRRRPRGLPRFRFPRQPVAGAGRLAQGTGSGSNESGAQLHLVDCVDTRHDNLAIAALRPGPGTRAAGVPLLVEVAVQNFGTDAGPAGLRVAGGRRPRPAGAGHRRDSCRASASRGAFPVLFATAGEHEITARLQNDAVAADNSRSLVVDVPKAVDVLVIDGDARAGDAFFLSTALAPGGKITQRLEAADRAAQLSARSCAGRLRNHLPARTSPGSNSGEIEALENYVKAGGGLGILHGRAVAGRVLQQGALPRRRRACFRCRWPARPSCWSTAWRSRPTWKSPTIRSSRSSPASATAS